jgi:hypothetical protein
MTKRISLLLLFIIISPVPLMAFDDFSELRVPTRFSVTSADGLRLVLKGQSEVSWRDIEGAGGEGHDSTSDTVTLGTRSGHADVDGLRIAFRLESPEDLAFYSAFLFDHRGARAEGAWLDHRWDLGSRLTLHSEAGLHTPIVAIDDRTSRAPLTARIYWGQPEMHMSSRLSGGSGDLRWWVAGSVAVMRPLDAEEVNDASRPKGTISVLSYGPAETFSGNQPVYGSSIGLGYGAIQLEGFGYRGTLSATRGIDELRNRIANFTLLPGYDASNPRKQDSDFWWGGGRVNLAAFGFEARLEWIESRESLLRRSAAYVQLGYVWSRGLAKTWMRTLELRLRGERYKVRDAGAPLNATSALRVVDPSQALTWDYDVATVSLCSLIYRDLVRLYLEHSLIAEKNGSSALGLANTPVRNNETTLQFELRF